MGGSGLGKAIDYQALFPGYQSFPEGQLPWGGIHATEAVLAEPGKLASLKILSAAFEEKSDRATMNRRSLRRASTEQGRKTVRHASERWRRIPV